MRCLDGQCQEHLEGIWNFSHTKFLCCINFLQSRTTTGDFSMQIERKEKMKVSSTHGIRTRYILVRTGLLINTICGTGGRNLQRTFTKKAITEGKSPFGLSYSTTAKSAKTFIRKTHAVWPIIADAPERLLDTKFGKSLASVAPGYMQDGVKPHTSKVVLDFLNTDFGHHVISSRFPDCHNGGKFWPLLSPNMNPCDFFRGVAWQRSISH
jgi:hypothetical protein